MPTTGPQSADMRIDMLPAGHGDCFVVQCRGGDRPIRLLIDGGTAGTAARLRQWIDTNLPDDRLFDLVVVTHVDADHIAGLLRLLDDPPPGFGASDIWFNGRQHLTSSRGPAQGERLTLHLNHVTPTARPTATPWNAAFDSRAVVTTADGPLTRITLREDPPVVVTLLSPTTTKLERLAPVWDREIGRVRAEEPTPEPTTTRRGPSAVDLTDLDELASHPTEPDSAPANGSSIALLVETGRTRALFAADAHPDTLLASIRHLNTERNQPKLPLDVFKLPHHASQANVTTEIIDAVSCPRYLISTNSAYFNHPDPVALARVIVTADHTPELHFNHRTARTVLWADPRHVGHGKHPYQATYREQADTALTLELHNN